MDKENRDTKTPWRRPAKGKFIALIPNEAGIIEPVEITHQKEDVTLSEVRKAVYRQALEVAQWAREALDETPQTPENEQWRQGLIWIGELGVDVMNIVNSPGINKPGTVLDLDIIVDIYQLALSCSFIGRCHQLAELADVLTKDQVQRALLSECQKLRTVGLDTNAKVTDINAKLEGVATAVKKQRRDVAAIYAEKKLTLLRYLTAGNIAEALQEALGESLVPNPASVKTVMTRRLAKAEAQGRLHPRIEGKNKAKFYLNDDKLFDEILSYCAVSSTIGKLTSDEDKSALRQELYSHGKELSSTTNSRL